MPAKSDPKRPATAANSRATFSVPDISARGHDVWITLCSERNTVLQHLDPSMRGHMAHSLGLLWCSRCGGHGFRPPCPKLMHDCEPLKKCSRQWLDTLLGRLRAGQHPDTGVVLGVPRPLGRDLPDPKPFMPKLGGVSRPEGNSQNSSSAQSFFNSGRGPDSELSANAAAVRDFTPVPRPIDFLSAYGKPKKPRLRSPSPCPYARAAVQHDEPADDGACALNSSNSDCALNSSNSDCVGARVVAGGFVFVNSRNGGKVGNPVGPRSLAAPHRLRSLLPLGKRVES